MMVLRYKPKVRTEQSALLREDHSACQFLIFSVSGWFAVPAVLVAVMVGV
jgi:hypothetical protein